MNTLATISKYSRLTLIACLLASQLPAATYKPYEDSKITLEQWQDYFDSVLSEFGETKLEVSDAMLVFFEDASSSTYYAFTLSEHPAHPAWVTRKLVDRDGDVSMELIGYYAGDEEPFSELFQDYTELSYQIQSDLEAQKETDE
jgi:hypothetical protein